MGRDSLFGIRFLGSAIVLLATAVAHADEKSLADVLPAETPIYLSVDVKTAVATWHTLDVVRLYRDPEVQEFIAPALAALDTELKQAQAVAFLAQQYGMPAIIDGRIEIGVLGFEEESRPGVHSFEPEPVMLIDTAGRESFESSLLRVLELDPRIEVVDADGARAIVFPPELGNGQEKRVHFAFAGDKFLASPQPAALARCLALLEGREQAGSSLSADPAFASWRKRCVRGGEVFELYVGVAGLLAQPEVQQLPESLRSEFDRFGVSALRGVGLAIAIDDGRLRDTFALVLPEEAEARKGMLALADALQPGAAILERIPVSAAGGVVVRLDAARVLDVIGAVAATDPVAKRNYDEVLDHFQEAMGYSLRDDFLRSVGAEAVLVAQMPKNGYMPELIGALELRDAARFQQILDQARKNHASQGIECVDLGLADHPGGFYAKVPGLPITPSFCVVGGSLLFGSTPQILKKAIASGGLKSAKLDDGSDLARCIRTNVGRDVGSLAGVAWFDLARAAVVGLGIAEPFLPAIFADAPFPLDAGKLPAPETIGSYLSGFIVTLRHSDDVLALEASGPVDLVVLMGGAAGIGIRSFYEMSNEFPVEDVPAPQHVLTPDSPFLGIRMDPNETGGVTLTSVTEGAPAAVAGLVAGDRITAIDDQPVGGPGDLPGILAAKGIGTRVVVTAQRAGEEHTFPLTIGRRGDYNP